MREFTEIKYGLEGGVARVTINRPERLNALGMNLAEEFNALVLDLAEEKDVRVVVLSGEGRAFSTGRDLKESATHLSPKNGASRPPRSSPRRSGPRRTFSSKGRGWRVTLTSSFPIRSAT